MLTALNAADFIKDIYENVDGGSCDSCTSDVIRVLERWLPDIDWRAALREAHARGDE